MQNDTGTRPGAPLGSGEAKRPESADAYRLRLEADLKIAERVHRSMLPATERRGNLDIVCDFQPMSGVGGDYASVHFQSDRRVVVGICDVAGHGVAAALLAGRVNSFVLNQAPHVHHPCELVDALNDFVFRTFRDTGLYLTFFSLFIDLDKRTVVGAGCGHPPVFLYARREEVIQRLESENTPIGLFEDLCRTRSMLEVGFTPGDRLVLYTDGLTEATNGDGLALGVDGLERYVKESAHQPPKKWVETIRRRLHDFRGGGPADDDQLLLAICYLDPKVSSGQ
jgi:two-component system sensor histidine kinase ChiS